jgi:bZIP transcription factor
MVSHRPSTRATKTTARKSYAPAPSPARRPSKPLPVLYKSSALAAAAPSLAFRRYEKSQYIAAAAAEADAVRDRFKAERFADAGVEEVDGEPEHVAEEKRYVRRLVLNRHSASASRLRKEAYISALEAQLARLEEKVHLSPATRRSTGATTDEDDMTSAADGACSNVTGASPDSELSAHDDDDEDEGSVADDAGELSALSSLPDVDDCDMFGESKDCDRVLDGGRSADSPLSSNASLPELDLPAFILMQ